MKNLVVELGTCFWLTLLVIFTCMVVAFCVPIDNALAFGITADLTLTAPLCYFFLIRNRAIPKTSVVPVFILGILLATWSLPLERQYYLDLIKMWLLPIVEFGVVGFIGYKVYQAKKMYRTHPNSDFYTQVLQVTKELFPRKISHLMATELSVPYYCFWTWKMPELKGHQFSYHKRSGSAALLWGFIMAIMVETVVLHLLLGLWSVLVAWVATILSLYACLQVIALIKSMARRPIELNETELWLKYGTFGDAKITWPNIKSIQFYGFNNEDKDASRLSVLGEMERPNILIELYRKTRITTAFGIQKEIEKILFFVDEKDAFIEQVEERISGVSLAIVQQSIK